MILWAVLTVMVALAAVGLTAPLVRRAEAAAGRGTVAALLRDQLAGVDAQIEAGAVSAAEAEGLRTEIKRRLLAEAGDAPAPAARPLSDPTRFRLALGVAAVVAVAAVGLYAALGRPDLPSATAVVAATAAADSPSARGEALVEASQGRVTPEAVALFRAAVAADPADPRGRFYLALARDQAGDRDGALNDWIAILNGAPRDAQWAIDLRTFVERLAAQRGVDLTGRLAPAPTADPAAAAEAMTPEQREAMIVGMVEGLEARLRETPLDREGWERLIRSRMVLGQPDRAAAALTAGTAALAARPAEVAALRETARAVEVPGS